MSSAPGTVATYAKLLGAPEEAARFAEYDDRDKALDQQLTEMARRQVNPRAEGFVPRRAPLGSPSH